MNFELAEQLTELLEQNNLESAIELAELELSKIPQTDFHIFRLHPHNKWIRGNTKCL